MDEKAMLGLNKKSFELNYHGGSIWAEHLDSMGIYEEEVIKKFLNDAKLFTRPSASSFLVINIDETEVTDHIIDCLVETIKNTDKAFRKIAFVGVGKKEKRELTKYLDGNGFLLGFFSDYEKAKEWSLSLK
ncbi:hypothetical protein lbkm_2247 [Lachnospiraceae bacterium KM106-2]|nr:hypothetical protein lbkm_2247 [Lachnospiraceae bacterium KM106-2]